MNVGIITQARMTSTRLPGKILLPLKDTTLLEQHIFRAASGALPVYVATTVNSSDNPVAEYCEGKYIPCFRGSEENVLERFYQTAVEFGLETIVRVTSDCPLIDGELIQMAYHQYLEWGDENIYYSNCLKRTYPRGFDFEIFSFKLLEEAYKNAKDNADTEHVTPYINKNKSGHVVIKDFFQEEDHSAYRLTVDTPDDYKLIKTLVEDYDCDSKNAYEIVEVLKEHPELAEINSHIEQKKV